MEQSRARSSGIALLFAGAMLPLGDSAIAINQVVPVFFATDRALTKTSPIQFGGTRGLLRYGVVTVSFPATHVVGELERPRWWRFEFGEDADDHVVIRSVKLSDAQDWMKSIRAHVAKSPRKRALMFVHGYNVSFADAARRSAQITADVEFEGATLLYSWPSRASARLYTYDGQDAEWTTPHLTEVINELVRRSGASEIYLIGHSMGNRALGAALKEIARTNPDARRAIKEVILAAPDIDADVFRTQIAPFLPRAARRVTLYASSRDRALWLSKQANDYARAGDAGPGLVIVPPIDTIDATAVNTDFFGHSYLSESPSILSDIHAIINNDQAPDQRFRLGRRIRNGQIYWRFKPAG